MKKKKKLLSILIPVSLLIILLFLYFQKESRLRPDFTYSRGPAVAGMATVIDLTSRKLADSFKDSEVGKRILTPESSGSAGPSLDPNKILDAAVKAPVDTVKSLIVNPALEKLGYVPAGQKEGGSIPCATSSAENSVR